MKLIQTIEEFDPDIEFLWLQKISETFDATINEEEISIVGELFKKINLKDYDPKIAAPIVGPFLFLKYESLEKALEQSEDVKEWLSQGSRDAKYIFKTYRETIAAKEAERTTYGRTLDPSMALMYFLFAEDKRVDRWPEVDAALAKIIGKEEPIYIAELNCGEGADLYSIALLVETSEEAEGKKVKIHGVGYGSCFSDLYNLALLRRKSKLPDRVVEIRGRSINPVDFFKEVKGGKEFDINRLQHVIVEFHPVFVANIYDDKIFQKLVSAFPAPHIVCKTDLDLYWADKVKLKGSVYTITH